MTFPTVKSNPYQKGVRRRRILRLWSAAFWRSLAKQAEMDFFATRDRDLSPVCIRMIGDMNEWLYGRR
jgi:hypothetical protein